MQTFYYTITVFLSLLVLYVAIAHMIFEGRKHFYDRKNRSVRFKSRSGQSVDLYLDRENSIENLSKALEILKENRVHPQND